MATLREITDLLSEVDNRSSGPVEQIVENVLLACMWDSPKFAGALTETDGLTWRKGPRYHADIVGYDTSGKVQMHVEIKTRRAQLNGSKGTCRRPGCPWAGVWGNQYLHFLEDRVPVLVVAPPEARSIGDWEWLTTEHLDDDSRALVGELGTVEYLTWSDVRDAALTVDDTEIPNLLRALINPA